MSKVQMLRASVKQRLTAAAEEIFVLFERSIAEYEEELCRSKEENERQRKLLDAVFNPQLQLHRAECPADVQQLLESKEEVPPEQQQEWSSSLDQEDPEPPHIKEEQEELWTSQEGEQLQGLEEADTTKLTFTPVPVKSEDDEEKPQSSQLHQRQTEQMETEADGEDCGGSEPARNLVHQRGRRRNGRKNAFRVFGCSECGKSYHYSCLLERHMRTHTGEKPFSCSLCGKEFTQKGHVTQHMAVHSAEKQFSCRLCHKRFTWRSQVKNHKCVQKSSQLQQSQTEVNREAEPAACSSTEQMETEADGEDCGGSEPARNSHPDRHLQPDTDDKTKNKDTSLSDAGYDIAEKPFNCSECFRRFRHKGHLQIHMRCHTGEKPFSCSVCGKRFPRKENLVRHMRFHSGEKPFSCSFCKKHFTRSDHAVTHMRIYCRLRLGQTIPTLFLPRRSLVLPS